MFTSFPVCQRSASSSFSPVSCIAGLELRTAMLRVDIDKNFLADVSGVEGALSVQIRLKLMGRKAEIIACRGDEEGDDVEDIKRENLDILYTWLLPIHFYPTIYHTWTRGKSRKSRRDDKCSSNAYFARFLAFAYGFMTEHDASIIYI